MAVAGSLTYDTKIDNSGFEKGLNNLKASTVAIGNVLASAFTKITSTIGTAITDGVKYNATIEQLTTSFEVMTGSANKSAEIVQKLKDIGAKTPFEFTGLAETVQLLMNYGLTADDSIAKMQMLGDISQGSAEKMNRIAMAYGQMSSAGKVQLEDIKQMIEAGFNPLQEISQSTGESMASLYARISKGTISVDEITASMERSTSAGGKYFQSMDKQSQTLNGQLSTLSDNFNNFIGTALEPINQVLAEKILPKLNEFLQLMTEKIETANWEEIINKIKELGNIIVPIAIAFATFKTITGIISIIQGVAEAFAMLNSVLLANPIVLIISLITGLVAGIIYLWNTNEDFKNALIIIWETVKSTFETVINAIVTFFTETIPNAFNNFITTLINFVNTVITWFQNLPYNIGLLVGQMLGHIIQFGVNAWNWVTTKMPQIINGIIEWFSKLPSNIWNWLMNTINKFTTWLNNMRTSASNGIRNVVNAIVNGFNNLPNTIMNIGKNLIQGLWNGITSMGNWIKDKIRSFANGIIDGMKSALGIHSPSTKFRDLVGKFIPQGIAVGIEADTSKALNAINNMDKSLIDEMSKSVLLNKNGIAVSGVNGTVNQILSANARENININNKLELDGEVVYENQKTVTSKKNLQYSFA